MTKLLLLISLTFLFSPKEEDLSVIAACPTFHYLLEENDIRSRSTAESISYFLEGEVDAFISGRMLKPGEPDLSYEIIGPGYSFIFYKELVILEKEMGNYLFYTDLDGVSEDFPYIKKIEKVSDVYNYIEEGIVITSAENTDYSKAEIVSVFKDNGERVRLSRTPIMYK